VGDVPASSALSVLRTCAVQQQAHDLDTHVRRLAVYGEAESYIHLLRRTIDHCCCR
jgi:hypothetical protein